MNFNLTSSFYEQACKSPNRLALSVGNAGFSYGELAAFAGRIAAWLREPGRKRPSFVALMASRSATTYAGILAAGWVGAAYVPLNPKAPDARISDILRRVSPEVLIVDDASLKRFSPALLEGVGCRILAPETERPDALGLPVAGRWDLPSLNAWPALSQVTDQDLAYVMFTSGTTGTPKGVMISAGNVAQFVAAMRERYPFSPEDRFSQVPETSFDLSVFDLFVTWAAGASLHVVPAAQLLGPSHFIMNNQLTVWCSVPSSIGLMQRMKLLRPGIFPSLRYSMFCGEALPVNSARQWRQAAPNSIVDNLYGPTEVTVACTGERLHEPARVTPGRGTMAIGTPFPGTEVAILDENLQCLPDRCPGELAISGKQVALGYYADLEQTARRFPILDGRVWYLTGDLAVRDESGIYHHLGRNDNQVKVLGNRVELEEVEAHLRAVCRSDSVAAVAWPFENGTAAGIFAFVAGSALTPAEVKDAMRQRVPAYMVPSSVIEAEALPLSVNGKVDRKALTALLEAGPGAGACASRNQQYKEKRLDSRLQQTAGPSEII